ncbi:MAG TPA: hypothetical protein VGE26_07885 [Sphingobacteriaceae bacterium]
MSNHTTPSFDHLRKEAIAYAKKHWIVYLFPVVFLAAGLYFITQDDTNSRLIGAVIALPALLRIVQASMVKWYLTPEYVVVQKGWPWSKKYEHIPVFELYKTDADNGKFSKFFNLGTLSAKGRENYTDQVKHINISNATAFSNEVTRVVQSSPAHPLNNAFELKEKGAISKEEYDLMKLGVMTHRYLA